MYEILNPGAIESEKDYRTITHESAMAIPYTQGGIKYGLGDIEHQHKVGICTAISLIQNAEKFIGKKYSPEFQYLLQKKFFDGNWDEGSSIFSALKAGKRYGFLPLELWTYTTEDDRLLPYSDYIAKLQAVPDSEVQRLIGLCELKLTGYAQVDTSTIENVAHAIDTSKTGILCMYLVGNEWWTSINGQISWNPIDIDPLRPPQVVVSGHAITASYYDFTQNKMLEYPNTWGITWNVEGKGHINYDNYQMREAWIPYYDIIPQMVPLPKKEDFHPTFKNCQLGDNNQAVKDVQTAMMILGYLPLIKLSDWGIYGPKTRAAVYKFQLQNVPMNFLDKLYQGRYFGPKTISALTKII